MILILRLVLSDSFLQKKQQAYIFTSSLIVKKMGKHLGNNFFDI